MTTPAATTTEVMTTTSPSKIASMILVAGGHDGRKCLATVEALTASSNEIQLPDLPQKTYGYSMLNHFGVILQCGSGTDSTNVRRTCWKLEGKVWSIHSTLVKARYYAGAVTTPVASFIFGGYGSSETTFEYLPKGSTNWQSGIYAIPGGFYGGCSVYISPNEVWLIGGSGSIRNRIVFFNVTSHTFEILSTTMNRKRDGLRCVQIPNTTKIMITGGNDERTYLSSTEIFDTSTRTITYGPSMNSERGYHGCGIMTILNEDRVVAFGGYTGSQSLDTMEAYNPNTNTWEYLSLKLTTPKNYFGFLTVKEGDI